MNRISTPPNLRDRLQHKIRAERALLDQVIETERRNFEQSFKSQLSAVLNTIESDMAVLSQRLNRRWLPPLILGLSLSIGICGGSWATMQYLASIIQTRMQTLQTLEAEIGRQQTTLAALREQTAGISLNHVPNGIFITVPEGAVLNPNWKLNGRPAWRLSTD